jgi:hypothetical protein
MAILESVLGHIYIIHTEVTKNERHYIITGSIFVNDMTLKTRPFQFYGFVKVGVSYSLFQ